MLLGGAAPDYLEFAHGYIDGAARDFPTYEARVGYNLRAQDVVERGYREELIAANLAMERQAQQQSPPTDNQVTYIETPWGKVTVGGGSVAGIGLATWFLMRKRKVAGDE